MNIIGAIVAGLVGTVAMSMVIAMAPTMGMPKMAIWEMLGTMFSKERNVGLGWVMHFMMGVVFAVIYAALWSAGIGSATWVGGVPMMHAGVKAGTVKAPGVYMTSAGGMMAFVGGLIGHVIYGLVVALVYGVFVR